jgi:gliding motility-associated-like protein
MNRFCSFIFIVSMSICIFNAPVHGQVFQDFEANNGGWVAQNNTHWNWGSPVGKPAITAASSGLRCWLAGDLNGVGYAGGTSYVESPVYNISTLANPEVSFKVFWETENNFDGVYLAYALNGSNNFISLGDINSNTNCNGLNWFNSSTLTYVGGVAGWSGSSLTGDCARNGGTGQWVLAKHRLANTAPINTIKFRFVFGAGTICNAYDGFAFDDFSIGAAVPNTSNQADFSYTCTGNNNVKFNFSLPFCAAAVSWNFGDPSSSFNGSSQVEPQHLFSGPGTYFVTNQVAFNNGTFQSQTRKVVILEANTQIVSPILCYGGNNGSLQVNANGGPSGTYNYSWSNGAVAPIITNLDTGNYIVQVSTPSADSACPILDTMMLSQPDSIVIYTEIRDATCNQSNGNIAVTIDGGVGGYGYLWSNGNTDAAILNLAYNQKYLLKITDANGCVKETDSLTINNIQVPALPDLGDNRTICVWENLVLRPGNFSSYEWQDGTTRPSFAVRDSGLYYVTVKNREGCVGSDTVLIDVSCRGIIQFPTAFSPNGDGLNDFFGPVGDLSTISEFNMKVFNRWGELLFESNNPFKKWNGFYKYKKSNFDTFIWTARFKINNGKSESRKGSVLVL